ncbi:MAG TPA: flagellar export protein FliJ [Candidatus Cybelea sp.]|jgi:flagellar export protein FliJ|nr:flagellar export protein FliJ [Candidatus Cybelea sp.]
MPARFRFDLQPLLESHERTEREQRETFERCRGALDECAEEHQRLAASRRRNANALAESSRSGIARDVRLYDEHLRRVDGSIECEQHRHHDLQAACERARDDLLAARRERRVIEGLKERRQRAFDAEERRRDELEIDEGNARRYDRLARERLARRASGTSVT